MTAEERQKRLRDYLLKVEFASLEELAYQVDASLSTVRRDLTSLEAEGGFKRTHGGARVLTPRSDEFTFSVRETHQLDEKEVIGKACADQIQPGQSLFIDAGTTVYHVARYLQDKTLQVVTNSLPVANLFAAKPRIEVVVSGGVIYPRLGVLVGPLAVEAFQKMHADVAVMSAGGITPDGLSNSHPLLIDLQRAMIQNASKVIFCLDHSKFGRKSVAFLTKLDQVDVVITDAGAPSEIVAELSNAGVKVIRTAPPATPAA